MATAPQIQLRDESGYTNNLVFSTNQETVVIKGKVDVNTADIQVSINGGPFVSDPTLVKFDLPNFTIPNLTNYPTGLILEPGQNVILVRTIDIVGGVSGASSITATKLRDSDVPQIDPPSGVKVRRLRNAVDLLAAAPVAFVSSPNNFRGFNFYASLTPAGTSGYYKINESIVTLESNVFDENAFNFGTDTTTWNQTNYKMVRLRVSEEDYFGNELAVRLDRSYSIADYTNKIRFKSSFEDVTLIKYLTFRHFRDGGVGIINEDQFSGMSNSDPLYYVVTAVYYDPITGIELESPYSQEILGTPLIIDTAIKGLPGRTQFDILTDFVLIIQRANQEITLNPGSTTRDVTIDPFSSEGERLYFVLDFIHKAQSFLTLLPIDDTNNDGISDPVESSSYKTALQEALGFTSPAAVQSLIDSAFDKLAANVNKKRLPGRPAIGQVVFYTTRKPTTDLTVPAGSIVSSEPDLEAGTPAVRFRVGGSYILPAVSADAYYNYSTKRYELVVDIVAEQIGETGNRPANTIKSAQGVSGMQVVNTESTVFGLFRETNAQLAARSLLGFVSVDTGTEGGYAATAAEQVGVIKSKIVKSGDVLMMRDYDPIRHKHIGGKVDVWVQGLRERQVTETFAFTFEVARDITCQIIDLSTLTLRVQDSRVTPNTPITEILDNAVQGLGVRNVTQGLDYDLTGVVIVDYQTFRLNPALPGQPVTNIDDVIVADYRFRVVNQFKFSFQPARRVVSVVGEISGALNPTIGYALYKTEDPLLEGESTIASDYLSINQVGGLPSGNSIVVNAEEHVLIGFIEEPLLSIGINTKTIRVFSQDRTIEYDGPETSSPDFDIVPGTPTTPAKIVRTTASSIVTGTTVSVDYAHDENFTVTYVINDLLQQFQRTLNVRRHVTADVIAKQAIQNSIEIETTVQLLSGATRDKTDPTIRTNVSLELNRRLIGQGMAQSDLINAIDSTTGVDFQVVPLQRMAYADGSRKLREGVSSNYVRLNSLDAGGNFAYLLTSGLKFPTTDGGGLATEHKGVFQDDEPLTLAPTLVQVATSARQAFIIGSGGAVIAGYTDAATLLADGYVTVETQTAELLRRTANHVVVALSTAAIPPETPTDHVYTASYVVRGDVGSKDFTASQVEVLDLGKFTITFREGS